MVNKKGAYTRAILSFRLDDFIQPTSTLAQNKPKILYIGVPTMSREGCGCRYRQRFPAMDLNQNFELFHFLFLRSQFFLVFIIVDSKGTKSVILWPTAEVQERLGLKVQFKSMEGNLYLNLQAQPFLGFGCRSKYNTFGSIWVKDDDGKKKSRLRKNKMALLY